MTDFDFKKYRLMTPGPVPIPKNVADELSQPMLHHRTPEFSQYLASAFEKLKKAFKTKQPVFIQTSAGSGAMEAAVANCFSPGDTVLCVVTGKFGERWAEMCRIFGLNVTELSIPWGETFSVSEVEDLLKTSGPFKGVLTQFCETSTATLHPIKELAELLKKYDDTLLIVDAITAIGAMPLEMDEWGIDVVVAGSQKAFMMPTGLSFISLSKKAWKAHKSASIPRFYFDLSRELDAYNKNQTAFSSSVSLIRGLNVALDSLTGEHLPKAIARSEALMTSTHKAVEHMGLTLYSQSPGPSVTAISVPQDKDGNQIDGLKIQAMMQAEFNITIAGGQDEVKGKILRIGHLGAITDEDQLATLYAVGKCLQSAGFDLLDEVLEKATSIAKDHLS